MPEELKSLMMVTVHQVEYHIISVNAETYLGNKYT